MQQAQQLGRYHLLDRVAFGGMAEIYRAKTADAAGRLHLVAVKRVLGHLSEDDEFIQMLIDEARLTALLRHANIAQLHEFTRIGSEYFIAMEYVDGKDVRALLEKAKQAQEFLAEEHIAYIGMMTARGLHAAHIQTDREGTPLRIVHRDVSPSNVLLSYAGDVKLCDFGIAKAQGARSQTKTGVIKGKVKYMSPEQAMGRKLDHRSDLFSLGTLMFEMLGLQAPFTATTEIELLFAVRDARRIEIDKLRPNVHPDLKKIVDMALAKSRSERFRTGEEMAESLKAFLDTYYPSYNGATLSRYLHSVFGREIEREAKTLSEYVIGGATSAELGENLLADVLGPDAEYTQFTAAFTQAGSAPPDLRTAGLPPAPPPPPPGAMRVLSSVTMPGTESIEEFDALPTAQKPRFEAVDLGVPEPIDNGPSAQTMPRGVGSSMSAPRRPTAGTPIVQGMPSPLDIPVLRPDVPAVPVDQEEGTMIIVRTPGPTPWAPVPASLPQQLQKLTPLGSGGALYDDEFHAQETRILTREQMELLKPKPAATPPQPVPRSGPSVVVEDGLHDASTQILDVRSLPANVQQVLARRQQPQPARPQTSPPVSPPPPLPASLPSLELSPIDGDFHEAQTAYLDWQPLEPETKLDLPEPSAMHPAQAMRQTGAHAPVAIQPPPMGRSATGLQPQVPLRPTGAQAPIAMPPPAPRPPSRPPAPPPPPPRAPSQPPAPPRSATRPPTPQIPSTPSPEPLSPPLSPPPRPTGAQAPISQPPPSRPTGAQVPITPRPTGAHAPISQPPPARPTGAQVPITPQPQARPTGAQVPITPQPPPSSRPTGAQAPISARPSEGRATPSSPLPAQALPPAPRPALQRPVVVAAAPTDGEEDEWESLPHLDSTMIAQASQMPGQAQSLQSPQSPVVPRPRPGTPAPMPVSASVSEYDELSPLTRPADLVDQGDMPTIPPPTSRSKDAPSKIRPSLAHLPKLDTKLESPLGKLSPAVGSAVRSRSLAKLLSLSGPGGEGGESGERQASPEREDPLDSTLTTDGRKRSWPAPASENEADEAGEDEKTPVRGTTLPTEGGDLAAGGVDDFEEDTNKGDVPRGIAQAGHHTDSAVELLDDDLEES